MRRMQLTTPRCGRCSTSEIFVKFERGRHGGDLVRPPCGLASTPAHIMNPIRADLGVPGDSIEDDHALARWCARGLQLARRLRLWIAISATRLSSAVKIR